MGTAQAQIPPGLVSPFFFAKTRNAEQYGSRSSMFLEASELLSTESLRVFIRCPGKVDLYPRCFRSSFPKQMRCCRHHD